MHKRTKTLLGLASAGVIGAGAVLGGISAANAAPGVQNNEALGLHENGTFLYAFELNDPDDREFIADVELEDEDTKLVGVDFRIQSRQFFGVGDAGGVYNVDSRDGSLTKVGQLSVELDGDQFGVDFNPAANALRIISDTGQNLRQPFAVANPGDPLPATVVDGSLSYGDGPAVGVTAAAYVNNDLSAETATTLLDIDTNLDQVALQVPANAGTLSATGKLGVNPSLVAGFDIMSKARGGRIVSNVGYATLRSSDTAQPDFYKIDLLSGKATKVGDFDRQIADLAVRQP